MVGRSTSNEKAEYVYSKSRSNRTDSHDENEVHLSRTQAQGLGLVREL